MDNLGHLPPERMVECRRGGHGPSIWCMPNIRVIVLLTAAVMACDGSATGSFEATGTLEVTEIHVSATVPARVVRVLVNEGASVRAGDTLAILTQPTLDAEILQRRARARAAEANLSDLVGGARTDEVRRAESELAAADAEAERATRDAERLRGLAERQVISAQQYDAARAMVASTVARRQAAAASLALVRDGSRAERIAAARAESEAAAAASESARATARDLVLLSPATGTVTTRNIEPGEVAPAGMPVVTVSESTRQYVRVFVSQDAVSRIQPGAPVRAMLDAYPEREFAGRVASIATRAEFTPRVALTERERNDLLFAVKVEFADTTGMLKAGLPITVRFDAPVPRSQTP